MQTPRNKGFIIKKDLILDNDTFDKSWFENGNITLYGDIIQTSDNLIVKDDFTFEFVGNKPQTVDLDFLENMRNVNLSNSYIVSLPECATLSVQQVKD